MTDRPPWRRGALVRGLMASLLLHLAVAFLWLRGDARVATRTPRMLVVELTGIVTNHQVAAQAARPHQPPLLSPEVRPTAVPPRRAARVIERAATEPPLAVDRQFKAIPEAAGEDIAASHAPPSETSATADGAQSRQQQTVAVHDVSDDAMRRYLAGLKRAIQRRLTYPDDDHAVSVVGATVIGFHLLADGGIQPGSLAVRASSGHAALDQRALAAAREAAPFAPPPRPMAVGIAVSFEQDP